MLSPTDGGCYSFVYSSPHITFVIVTSSVLYVLHDSFLTEACLWPNIASASKQFDIFHVNQNK